MTELDRLRELASNSDHIRHLPSPLILALLDCVAALNGLIGLVQLVTSRSDLPTGLDDVMRLNHRMVEALRSSDALDAALREKP